MKTNRWMSLSFSLLLAACGGGDTGGEDMDDTAGGEEPGDRVNASARELIGINGPEQPWSEMAHDDREMDMVARFHPIFRELFQEHDAEEYAEFGCESCHGSDMREREFEMPSPHLPPVPMAGTDGYREMAAQHQEVVQFMEETVTPTMQTMLGMGATFTCNGCHPVAEGGSASTAPRTL
jgi:hypothetical protein